ncbi:hypothetical protein ACFE04_004749 [Oxalis oulophora]
MNYEQEGWRAWSMSGFNRWRSEVFSIRVTSFQWWPMLDLSSVLRSGWSLESLRSFDLSVVDDALWSIVTVLEMWNSGNDAPIFADCNTLVTNILAMWNRYRFSIFNISAVWQFLVSVVALICTILSSEVWYLSIEMLQCCTSTSKGVYNHSLSVLDLMYNR